MDVRRPSPLSRPEPPTREISRKIHAVASRSPRPAGDGDGQSGERTRDPVSHVDDCRKFIQYLSEHVDGELDPELEVEFMLHLQYCEKARAILHTFERTIILHRQTRRKVLPRDVHERLRAAIRACQESDE